MGGGRADRQRTEGILGTRLSLINGGLLLALGEREAVGHFQSGVHVETQQLAGHKLGQVLAAVLDDLKHHLLSINAQHSGTKFLFRLCRIGCRVADSVV